MEIPRYVLAAVSVGVMVAAGWASTRPDPPALDAASCEAVLQSWRSGTSTHARAQAVACLGLSGDVTRARAVLGRDTEAARIAFDLVHPLADAGEDARTFEVMALVVDADPDHFQALYHAGIGASQLGRTVVARAYLERFLAIYTADDGFTRNARAVLATLP